MDTHSGVDASLSVADPETRYRGSNKYEIYAAAVIFLAEFTEAMVDLGSDTDSVIPPPPQYISIIHQSQYNFGHTKTKSIKCLNK